MAVVLTFSSTAGAAAVNDPNDFGTKANGQTTSASTLYLRHNGSNSITGVGFYISSYTGAYTGSVTALDDFNELKAWGDSSIVNGFGGLQVNQNATGAFPDSSWPTFDSHLSSDSKGYVFNSSQGSTSLNAINLLTSTGATASGELQTGTAPNVRLQLRVQVPTNTSTTGIRQFTLNTIFTFTS